MHSKNVREVVAHDLLLGHLALARFGRRAIPPDIRANAADFLSKNDHVLSHRRTYLTGLLELAA
jgi:hypothetical protein